MDVFDDPAQLHVSQEAYLETAMFVLDRVNFKLPAALLALSVSNGILVLALDNHRALRIDLQQANHIEDIDLPRKLPDDRVRRIFVDPTGRHVVFSTEKGENYYLFTKWKTARAIKSLKGYVLESAAWSRVSFRSYDASSRAVLFGTHDGRIVETELEPSESLISSMSRDDKYVKQQFVLPDKCPVTGLHFEPFPNNPKRGFVLATTSTRIYQFVGPLSGGAGFGQDGVPVFDRLFRSYDGQMLNYQDMPTDSGASSLAMFAPALEKDVAAAATTQTALPERFTWLNGAGLYSGYIAYQGTSDSLIENQTLLPLPANMSSTPMAVLLTEFHSVLLYKDCVVSVCQLNDQLVYEEQAPQGEAFLGMIMDPVKQTYWLYTSRSFYELIVTDESRDVWRLYLERRVYDLALRYARGSNQQSTIHATQADHYFEQEKYVPAAVKYAESARPFEDIALKFIWKEQWAALREFLRRKLRLLKGIPALICSTWLLELHLDNLNRLDDMSLMHFSEPVQDDVTADEAARAEFRLFIDDHSKLLDQRTTYQMIESYARFGELVYYATKIGDHARVIQQFIDDADFQNALVYLEQHASIDCYYKFASALMQHRPADTVDVWMRRNDLDVRQLLPALLLHQQHRPQQLSGRSEVVRFLRHMIDHGCQDGAAHNYLLALYVSQPGDNESELLEFIKLAGDGPDGGRYDVDYALRLCTENGRDQSCVYLYGRLGMHEEAVDLALKINDTELARIYADRPQSDSVLRKRLWLKIARTVVEEKKDIKAAMQYLQHCSLLKIEDILPFFPDFVLIDEFKDEICNALEGYNRHIEELREGMDESTRSAEAIRRDMEDLKHRFSIVTAEDRCGICRRTVLSRQFYVFPCQHCFHAECLIHRVSEESGSRQRARIQRLQDRIQAMAYSTRHGRSNGASAVAHTDLMSNDLDGLGLGMRVGGKRQRQTSLLIAGEDARPESELDLLRSELDATVAGECALCGELMIRAIDRPFVSADDADEVASWAV